MNSSIADLYRKITKTLIEKKLTITTMESCTSGLIASLLTDTEGSSAILKGAFITYSNMAKILQGVSEKTIENFGVYSEETAVAMAEAAKKAYGSDFAIGVTGSFGNVDPNNADSVPGIVHYAISGKDIMLVRTITLTESPDRFSYKLQVAEAVGSNLLNLIS